ncbi:MAG: sulfite exporter TauE/SafE family protein, partial [Octadecabacter sp.]
MAVAVLAGLVKGVVGFAMPMIFISGLTLVLPPEQALAALIVPTLVTNGWQALRQGIGSAIQTVGQLRKSDSVR